MKPPEAYRVLLGRSPSDARPRVAVLAPSLPFPPGHESAPRPHNLLREAAREFDVFLLAFTDGTPQAECGDLLDFCAQVILVQKPCCRAPSWFGLAPPEVRQYRSPLMQRLLRDLIREQRVELVQVEHPQLAEYGGHVLVAHPLPQGSPWEAWRWRWFAMRAMRRFRCLLATSEEDAALLNTNRVAVIRTAGEQRRLWREVLIGEVGIRPAEEQDLDAIRRIQSACPQAAQWEPRSYLAFDCRVAVAGERVAGFVVLRQTGPGEYEVLNLAVAPDSRRRGLGAALMRAAVGSRAGEYFLEVRESNQAAQALYRKLGFREAGRRPQYYSGPAEAAIVMRLQSC